MIHFLIDAQLPPGLARRLANRGYTAEHVNRIGMAVASDAAIWRHVARTGATLVTKDEDFVALARNPRSQTQVVWIRLGNISNEGLWSALDLVLDDVVQSLNAGEKIIEII